MRGQTERFLGHIPGHRATRQSGNVPSVPSLVQRGVGVASSDCKSGAEAPQSIQIAIVVAVWVRLHLNPAIWEAIAGTGWGVGGRWAEDSDEIHNWGLSALSDAKRVLWEAGAEVAGGEGFDGAEAGGEQAGGETAFAEEAAEEF
jgi:hypothetical protein